MTRMLPLIAIAVALVGGCSRDAGSDDPAASTGSSADAAPGQVVTAPDIEESRPVPAEPAAGDELPRTASSAPLAALVGASALAMAAALHFTRVMAAGHATPPRCARGRNRREIR